MKLILVVLLLLVNFNSHAALNKWVDSNGKVHYSDSAPPDIKVEKLRSSPSADADNPPTDEVAPKSVAERALDWKKSQQVKEKEEQKAAIDKENEAIKRKNCEGARGNLAGLENSRVLITYNAQGERNFMDDDTRAKRLEEARNDITKFCN